jgi:hypothetical protein
MGPSRPYFEADCLEGLPRRIPASRAGPSEVRAAENPEFGITQCHVVLGMPIASTRQHLGPGAPGPSGSSAGSLHLRLCIAWEASRELATTAG